MHDEQDDQAIVAAVLASRPADRAPGDFLARVNARIDALRARDGQGWFAIADFRTWTLRLIPLAGVLALAGFLWPGAAATAPASPAAAVTTAQTTPAQPFAPGLVTDWQRDVTANALLDAALHRAGDAGAR